MEGERVALSTLVAVLGAMGAGAGGRDEFDAYWGE